VRAQARLPEGLVALSLLLVTVAIFWPATRCDFVSYDDEVHVTQNAQVQKGLTWESIKWACFNPVNSIWHPLTVWSHMADCQLFGLRAWGHHLTSVVLHALNVVLVFLLLRGLTGAVWRSALVAVLFGWHPLHVESAAWVSERKDVLSAFFGLLALIAYTRYAKGTSPLPEDGGLWAASRVRSWGFYLLSLCLFALGLMSKPMLVTWPFVMLLLDYWPLRRFASPTLRSGTPQCETTATQVSTVSRLVREKIPFFALAGLASLVTFVAQKRGGSLAVGESFPLSGRFENALISYCRYAGKLFWPTNLVVFYPRPEQWPQGKLLLAAGLVVSISVVAWVLRRRYPYLLMGWLWYCGTLVPVSQVVQTGAHAMADRYTYLPSLGVIILTVWGAYELGRRWQSWRPASAVPAGAAIGLCLALTHLQISYWRDSEALFRHAAALSENNYLAHNNLGVVLAKKGQIDEAIDQYQEALRLKPGYGLACNNLGVALGKKGQADKAIRYFREAVRLIPHYAEAHYDLGIALGRKGQIDEAIHQLQETIRLKPDHAQAHNDLGTDFYRQGDTDDAIRLYQEAIRLKPDYAEAHYNLGIAFYQQRRIDQAIHQFQEALRLKPGFAAARRNLDAVLAHEAQSSPPSGVSTDP
jgi:tetratricopeptide (TPR) repeat protein